MQMRMPKARKKQKMHQGREKWMAAKTWKKQLKGKRRPRKLVNEHVFWPKLLVAAHPNPGKKYLRAGAAGVERVHCLIVHFDEHRCKYNGNWGNLLTPLLSH